MALVNIEESLDSIATDRFLLLSLLLLPGSVFSPNETSRKLS